MLHDFLVNNKIEILALAEEKTLRLAGLLGNSPQLKLGLPLFYDQLIWVLNQKLAGNPQDELLVSAASHGREFLRLGYSLSHVVHAYGAMCQAITELATIKNAQVSPKEFNILNGCLDIAIASAVSEFQFRSNLAVDERETRNLGFFAHELRNALSSAAVASEMISAGLVGTGGSTAKVLEANLSRMRHIIDQSLAEVRLRADSDLIIEKFRLSDLLDEVTVTAKIDAQKKKITFHLEADSSLELEADRYLILSAIANLIQNAIKYTKSNGKIWLRAAVSGDEWVRIEVEDECGGINTPHVDSLFVPFTQDSADKTGLGLGLSITRRAIQLSQGKITVNNIPGKGCKFLVDLPKRITSLPSNKKAVQGKDSIQPDFSKK